MNKAGDYITDKDLVKVLDYEKMRDNREVAAKEEGFNDGFSDGAIATTQVIVKNMLNENADINFISKVTGLTIEEINKLK